MWYSRGPAVGSSEIPMSQCQENKEDCYRKAMNVRGIVSFSLIPILLLGDFGVGFFFPRILGSGWY